MKITWKVRAFLWGFFHPFATKEQHLERAKRAARLEAING